MKQQDSIAARIDRLELPFDRFGLDPYGVSKQHLQVFLGALAFLYRRWFRVRCYGHENVPARGRAMLVGNHSGGIAIDGAMVIASLFLEREPPRLAQGMAEKFLDRFPLTSVWASRTGQLAGLPEHAERLLRDERLLLVFPEGSRGTAKLYPQRYSLVEFGTGFMRLALRTGTPIVPFGFLGGGDAIPTIANAYRIGRALGVPYLPITPWLLPLPLPVPLEIRYGTPLTFPGRGDEEDEVIAGYIEQVKARITGLLEEGRRGGRR